MSALILLSTAIILVAIASSLVNTEEDEMNSQKIRVAISRQNINATTSEQPQQLLKQLGNSTSFGYQVRQKLRYSIMKIQKFYTYLFVFTLGLHCSI